MQKKGFFSITKIFTLDIKKHGVGELITKSHSIQNTYSLKSDNNFKITNRELQIKSIYQYSYSRGIALNFIDKHCQFLIVMLINKN